MRQLLRVVILGILIGNLTISPAWAANVSIPSPINGSNDNGGDVSADPTTGKLHCSEAARGPVRTTPAGTVITEDACNSVTESATDYCTNAPNGINCNDSSGRTPAANSHDSIIICQGNIVCSQRTGTGTNTGTATVTALHTTASGTASGTASASIVGHVVADTGWQVTRVTGTGTATGTQTVTAYDSTDTITVLNTVTSTLTASLALIKVAISKGLTTATATANAADIGAVSTGAQWHASGCTATYHTGTGTGTATDTATGTSWGVGSDPTVTCSSTSTNTLHGVNGVVFETSTSTSTSTRTATSTATSSNTVPATDTYTITGTVTGSLSSSIATTTQTWTGTKSGTSTGTATSAETGTYSRTWGPLSLSLLMNTTSATVTSTATVSATATGSSTTTVSGTVTGTVTATQTDTPMVDISATHTRTNIYSTELKTQTGVGTVSITQSFTGTITATGTQTNSTAYSTASKTGTATGTATTTGTATGSHYNTDTLTDTNTVTNTATSDAVAHNPTIGYRPDLPNKSFLQIKDSIGTVGAGIEAVPNGDSGLLTGPDKAKLDALEPPGVNWILRSNANAAGSGVVFCGGKHIGVGWGGQVQTSDDAILWTARTSGNALNWNAIACASGTAVAVGQSGTGSRVMTSADGGVTWSSRSSAGDYNWMSVAYSTDFALLIAVSLDGNIMTSADLGTTWTLQTSPFAGSFTAVACGGGSCVAAASGGGAAYVARTTNGTTWASVSTAGIPTVWNGLVFAAGKYVGVGSQGRVLYSSDGGLTWQYQTVSGYSHTIMAVTYGWGLFVAVTMDGVGNRVLTSIDGMAWTPRASAADMMWLSVEYAGGMFVSAGSGIMTSGISLASGGVPYTRRIDTTNGLQGGGDLSANRTLSPVYGSTAGTVMQGNDRSWAAPAGSSYTGCTTASTTLGSVTSCDTTLRVPTSLGVYTINGLQGGNTLGGDLYLSPVFGSSANTVMQGNDRGWAQPFVANATGCLYNNGSGGYSWVACGSGGGGNVSGSGTSGYLTAWTGTSTVGNGPTYSTYSPSGAGAVAVSNSAGKIDSSWLPFLSVSVDGPSSDVVVAAGTSATVLSTSSISVPSGTYYFTVTASTSVESAGGGQCTGRLYLDNTYVIGGPRFVSMYSTAGGTVTMALTGRISVTGGNHTVSIVDTSVNSQCVHWANDAGITVVMTPN